MMKRIGLHPANQKRGRVRLAVGLLLATGLSLCRPAPPGPAIRISDVWSRPVAVPAEAGEHSGYTGVIYLTIANDGSTPDRLQRIETAICRVAEMHETLAENNRMRMQKIEGGLDVPVRGTLAMKPGGVHVMLIDLRRALHEGDTFGATLVFEKSGAITVRSTVRLHGPSG